MLPLLAAALHAQDRSVTHGKSYAQILAMGRTRWHDLFVGREGGSTAGEAGAEGIYADALAWRNDRLLKGRKSSLRERLQAFSGDAQGVGSATTGGGTMWNITAASLYADEEETLYRVLTHSGRGPRRVVSDIDPALRRLAKGLSGIEEPKDLASGRAAMARLRIDLRRIVAEACRLSRRDSDLVLDFCRSTAAGVAEQAGGV